MSEARFKWHDKDEIVHIPEGSAVLVICDECGLHRLGDHGQATEDMVTEDRWVSGFEARAAIDFAIEAEKLLRELLTDRQRNASMHGSTPCLLPARIFQIKKLLEAKP